MSRSIAFFISATVFVMIGLLFAPGSAEAQFRQWTEPGSTSADEPDRRQELEEAIDKARWQVGGLRIHPWISLHQVQYVDNIFSSTDEEAVADITATLGAGLRAHLPLGENAFFAIHALPEYVWWQDLTDRRRLNGRYGAGLFGFYNRMAVEFVATRNEQQGVVTPEFEQLVNSRRDEIRALLDVNLVRSFGVHLTASVTRFENLLDEEAGGALPALDMLDREEQVVRAGIKVVLADKLGIRAGIEDSQVDYEPGSLDQSNSGTAPFLDVRFDGHSTILRLDVAYRDLTADGPTSRFLPFEELTGSLRIGTPEDSRIQLNTYGSRNLVYSLNGAYAYFLDTSYGAAFGIGFGDRVLFGVFADFGDHDYEPYSVRTLSRVDDVTSFGASLSFDLGWGTSLAFRATRSDYDSNLDLFDRKVTTAGFSFRLGEIGWP